jgi:hypothetical protein
MAVFSKCGGVAPSEAPVGSNTSRLHTGSLAEPLVPVAPPDEPSPDHVKTLAIADAAPWSCFPMLAADMLKTKPEARWDAPVRLNDPDNPSIAQMCPGSLPSADQAHIVICTPRVPIRDIYGIANNDSAVKM